MSGQMIFDRDYKLIIKPDNENNPLMYTPPMQVKFTVMNSASNSFATSLITIYGLSKETRNRLQKKNAQGKDFKGFGKVELFAGYKEQTAMIFSGKINYIEIGREGVNLYTRLYCASNLEGWRDVDVNHTWSGNTPAIEVLSDIASLFGLRVEFNGDFSDIQPFVRGYSSSRKAHQELDDMSYAWGFTWRFTSSSTVLTRNNATRNSVPIEISAKNGMEGVPRFYFDKTEVDVKLDGRIQPDDRIRVSSEFWSVNYNAMYYTDLKNYPQQIINTAIFKVLSTTHEGDFWGDTWKSTLACFLFSGGGINGQ